MAASGHPCGALRPGQNAPGRQVGRPLSPARVRAMPERFVVIERPKNRFIRKKVGQHRALNGLQQRAEVARHAFEGQGTPKGREAEKTALRAFGEVCRIWRAESVLRNQKSSGFQRSRPFDAAHHSPPPLASEGSESPSVVRDAGGGALRFLDCTPD